MRLPEWMNRHPVLSALATLVLMFVPAVVEPWWSLYSNEPLLPKIAGWVAMQEFGFSSLLLISIPVGLWLLWKIYRNTQPSRDTLEPLTKDSEGEPTRLADLVPVSESEVDEWLSIRLKEDVTYCASRVYCWLKGVDGDKLEAATPSITLNLRVCNGTFYDVRIGDEVEGAIALDECRDDGGKLLARPPELRPKVATIPHGGCADIRMIQFLTISEAKEFGEYDKQVRWWHFDSLRISVRGRWPKAVTKDYAVELELRPAFVNVVVGTVFTP